MTVYVLYVCSFSLLKWWICVFSNLKLILMLCSSFGVLFLLKALTFFSSSFVIPQVSVNISYPMATKSLKVNCQRRNSTLQPFQIEIQPFEKKKKRRLVCWLNKRRFHTFFPPSPFEKNWKMSSKYWRAKSKLVLTFAIRIIIYYIYAYEKCIEEYDDCSLKLERKPRHVNVVCKVLINCNSRKIKPKLRIIHFRPGLNSH